MPVYTALDAVSAAVYTTLNVAALTALAPGGVSDDIGQLTTYPCVFYEVRETVVGGFGSKPGSGKRNLEVDVRVHVFSQYAGMLECHQVMAKVNELLADAPAVTGFGSWAIFHDETVALPDEVIAGQRVRELVSIWRLMLSES